MTPIKVGVIGFGYTGQIHTRAYLAEPSAQLVAIADSRVERLADLPSGVRGYATHEELVESGVDAVSICLPTYLHCRITLDALTRGKHVLVEKPIAANMQEARRMLQAANQTGCVLFVGMTHRFYPELREAKKLIDEGAIGTIVACNDCALEHLGFLNVPSWYMEKRYSGGGPALTSGVHLADRLRWFTGDEVNMVAGSATNRYFGGDVEDAGQIFLKFRSGISAQITVAFMRNPHPLVCDLQVIGTRGSMIIHTWQGYEFWNQAGHHSRTFYTDQEHGAKVQVGVAGEVREFCASILEGRAPWPTAEDSTRSFRVVMAYYEAAETGRAIKLGDFDAV